MKSKEKRKTKPRFQRLKKIMTCSLMFICIPVLLFFCYIAIWIGGIIHADAIAGSMSIPSYPDSHYLYDYFGGYYSKTAKIYCSSDDIETVLDYYKVYVMDTKSYEYASPDMKYQSYTTGYFSRFCDMAR